MDFDKILYYLNLNPSIEKERIELEELFKYANEIKNIHRGNKVWFRGLIEISNICVKDCYYCGIRNSNKNVKRYELLHDMVIKEAQFALDSGYGSVVIQSGERIDNSFRRKITDLIYRIKELKPSKGSFGEANPNPLGITLSLGEHPIEVYREWYNAGAHRYLLRIESSNEKLYSQLHPDDSLHIFADRLKSINNLMLAGFKTGTGVMIGVPGQRVEDLANDLLFFKKINIGMVGMGPYIYHSSTPLGQMIERGEIKDMDAESKLWLSLKMIAILRILMPNINIAATTALQVLNSNAREKALLCGANVIMPNITDLDNRHNYNLYEGKPGVSDDPLSTKLNLVNSLKNIGVNIGWNELGD